MMNDLLADGQNSALLFADAAGTLDAGMFVQIARRCSDGPDYTSMQLSLTIAARLFAARTASAAASPARGEGGEASAALLEMLGFANDQLRRALDGLGLSASVSGRGTALAGAAGTPTSPSRAVALANTDLARSVTHALLPLLKDCFCRSEFIKSASGIPQLTRVVANFKALEKAASTQLLYEAAASLWLLSYAPSALPALVDAKAVGALVEMSKGTDSNKLVRVTLLAMVNLLGAKLGEFILFTVTFHANPAHDLTCPPSYIII